MPQGRRKVPFSGKQKKQQLQLKKDRKKSDNDEFCPSESNIGDHRAPESVFQPKLFANPAQIDAKQRDPDRYRLQFVKESREEVEQRKKEGFKPLNPIFQESVEVDIDDVFLPGSVLDFPKRPKWNFKITKEKLETQEKTYFMEYLMNIEKNFNLETLSYFETNLETWRQLWRVLEMADIVLIIVDIRYPSVLFSPAVYEYVVTELNRDVILVLNKIDLVPRSVVVAWKYYFEEKYPKLRVVCFTSFPGRSTENEESSSIRRKSRRGNLKMAAQATKRLLAVCKDIVTNNVDLSSWEKKIEDEIADQGELEASGSDVISIDKFEQPTDDKYERFYNGVLTIGCIGFPNVGKSSLMNGIMGKKVVSVSRTPGHTKHFQTIFLTPTVKLCDCPGLVFPSQVPKSLQVLSGSFPIAQVREPYSSIRYLAERIPLNRLLAVQHPDKSNTWSPFDICEAWAEKRGFYTNRGARKDAYRAGNNILRMALEGRIRFYLRPPGFSQDKHKWDNHLEIDEITKILESESTAENGDDGDDVVVMSSSEEEEETTTLESSRPKLENKFAVFMEI